MFGIVRGLLYFLLFFSLYAVVPALWYLPRMRAPGPDGTSYRLYLAGQCVAFMGILLLIVPLVEIRRGELQAVVFLLALGSGALSALVVVSGSTRRWERQLRDKARIESRVREGIRYLYLALAVLFISENYGKESSPLLKELPYALLSYASCFLFVWGAIIWLWAARKERDTKRAVQIFFRATRTGVSER